MYDSQLHLIIILLLMFIIMSLGLLAKYQKFDVKQTIIALLKSSWILKGLYLVIIIGISVSIYSFNQSPHNHDEILNSRDNQANYLTAKKVDDGFIVAGYRSKMVHTDTNYERQERGVIEKYTFDGGLIWSKSMPTTSNDGEEIRRTRFDTIEIKEDNTILVHGLEHLGYYYAEMRLDLNGTIIDTFVTNRLHPRTFYKDPNIFKLKSHLIGSEHDQIYLSYQKERFGSVHEKTFNSGFSYQSGDDSANLPRHVTNFLYQDDDYLIIGVHVYTLASQDRVVYNKIKVFNHQLELKHSINLPTDMIATELKYHNGAYYVLGNGAIGENKNRIDLNTSFIGTFDEDFNTPRFRTIRSSEKKYFHATKLHLTDAEILIGGNKTDSASFFGGFNVSDTYSGAVYALDYETLEKQETYDVFNGQAVNDFFFKDSSLYTLGFFNNSYPNTMVNQTLLTNPGMISVTHPSNRSYIFITSALDE